jgi:hypothetical protein
MATLAEIRAKIKDAETRTGTSNKPTEPSAVYPHWNIPDGGNTTIRFLPDGDPNNIFFWVERQTIKLPFAGIKGEADMRPVVVKVPCIEMYDSKTFCPILTEIRPWFKDKALEPLALKYWKKRSYIYQGFVVKDGLNEENPPEGKIRRFSISPQLHTIIKASVMDDELEEIPTHYLRGLDFTVYKTRKGDYSEYTTSKFARRERALDDDELNAIETEGLFNLSDWLPPKPTPEELRAIKEMFEASVDGDVYDLDRWGEYYKPSGFSAQNRPVVARSSESNSTLQPPKNSSPKINEDTDVETDADSEEPWPNSEPVVVETATQNRAQDIINMIRNRQPAA